MSGEKKVFWVLDLVGQSVARNPKSIRALLRSHNVGLPDSKSEKQIINALIFAITTKGDAFHQDLGKLLRQDILPSKEDAFLGGLQGETTKTEGSSVNMGSNPISAVLGLISSGLNIVGNTQQKKERRRQARSQVFSSLIQYKQQQQQAAIEQINEQRLAQLALRKQQEQQAYSKNLIFGMGMLATAALLGFVIYNKKTKTNT